MFNPVIRVLLNTVTVLKARRAPSLFDGRMAELFRQSNASGNMQIEDAMLKKMSEPSREPAPSAIHLLHRASQCADELLTGQIGQSGLTPRQYAVLKAVDESENPSQTTLIEKTGVDRSTIADIVRRLVEKGLLERQRTKRDQRLYSVQLTEAGRGVLRRSQPAERETTEHLLSCLEDAEREQFIHFLDRIVATNGPIASARVTSSR